MSSLCHSTLLRQLLQVLLRLGMFRTTQQFALFCCVWVPLCWLCAKPRGCCRYTCRHSAASVVPPRSQLQAWTLPGLSCHRGSLSMPSSSCL